MHTCNMSPVERAKLIDSIKELLDDPKREWQYSYDGLLTLEDKNLSYDERHNKKNQLSLQVNEGLFGLYMQHPVLAWFSWSEYRFLRPSVKKVLKTIQDKKDLAILEYRAKQQEDAMQVIEKLKAQK